MCGDDQLAVKAKAEPGIGAVGSQSSSIGGGREVKGAGNYWHSVAMQDPQPGESTP